MFKRFAVKQPQYSDQGGLTEPFWEWYSESFIRRLDSSSSAKDHKKLTASSSSVVTLQRWFENLHYPVPSVPQTIALIRSPFSSYDLEKAFHLIRYFQLCNDGLFLTNAGVDKSGARILFKGAENWENVMCYLDALLFSMFANLESFEPILFVSNQHSNYLVNQLASILRVYVSLLRSGNLITIDLTERLCEVLMKLGFAEAMSHKQQDSAALFEFLTETLSMPLLTFKIDIKHGGKFSKDDDQKYSKERILFVSIPEDDDELVEVDKSRDDHVEDPEEREEAEGILLEECLEHYFNNSISVKRELERRATLESLKDSSAILGGGKIETVVEGVRSKPSFSHAPKYSDRTVSEQVSSVPNTPSSFTSNYADNFEFPPTDGLVECVPESSRTSSEVKTNSTEFPSTEAPPSSNSADPAALTSSVARKPQRSDSSKSNFRIATRTRSSTLSIWSFNDSTKKEVSLPAWMFLRLLPFYTDDNNTVGSDPSVANTSKEFVNRRPILPICLKRYSFDSAQSSANRSTKRIIIPPIIFLPKFVADDADSDHDFPQTFKLILESAICHRGTSISSGHFVSAIRKNTKNENETDEEAYNAPWYLYDDMNKGERVVDSTFKDIFSTEWPYMLFYRLVSDEESLRSSNSSINTKTPVIVPHGSKGKYWTDESNTLSPILSQNYSSSLRSDDESTSLQKQESIPSSSLSIPLPDVLPGDSRFIDIREKYFWYVTDKDKNYYKELPTVSTHGTRGPSISISPQFRRNSQWSEKSFNSINQQVLGGVTDLNQVNDELSKLKASDDVLQVKKLPEIPKEKVHKEHKPDHSEIKRSKSLFHKHTKKRETYKKDKCVVM